MDYHPMSGKCEECGKFFVRFTTNPGEFLGNLLEPRCETCSRALHDKLVEKMNKARKRKMEIPENERKRLETTDKFLRLGGEMTEQEKGRLEEVEKEELKKIEIEFRFFFRMLALYLETNYTGGSPMNVSDGFTYKIFKRNGLYSKLYREIVKPVIDAIVEEARWESDRDYRWESIKGAGEERGDE